MSAAAAASSTPAPAPAPGTVDNAVKTPGIPALRVLEEDDAFEEFQVECM